tara:strand:- start:5438 stop:5938 length:501 start_codon:yes stop_codon:yes gene_type:complete
MEPITTALAAVSAASSAISFIKERISDAQSVSEISGQISTLFSAQQKLNEERNKQAGVGDISFKSSIDAVLESKKLAEELNTIRTLIDLRFGPGTYLECVNHYNQAQRAQKEARQAAMREKARQSQEFEETLKAVALTIFVIAVAVCLFIFMFAVIARSAIEEIVL